MFMLASKSKNIRNLLLGLFSGISAADRPSLVVNEQHLDCASGLVMPKETFQHKNRELHRSLVVIQQQYVATLEVRHYGSTWPRPHPLGRLHGATSVITSQ